MKPREPMATASTSFDCDLDESEITSNLAARLRPPAWTHVTVTAAGYKVLYRRRFWQRTRTVNVWLEKRNGGTRVHVSVSDPVPALQWSPFASDAHLLDELKQCATGLAAE